MAKSNNTLCLDKFYPEKDLMITDIDQQSDKIIIQMKSTSSSCKCPKCNRITQKYHGTYTRKVQDLPILGKNVQLEICSHEYACLNDECEVISIAETFDGFLNNYSRITERCVDFICTLALETSCEGCARVCRTLGIKTSGDTVIRLLLKRYESLPQPEVSDVIGVDDFAYKKRHTYGTIIVNEKTHEPITLLNGRNGDTLRNGLRIIKMLKWLQEIGQCICESNIRRITRCNAGGRPISFTSESTGNNKKSSESRNPCNNKYPTQ